MFLKQLVIIIVNGYSIIFITKAGKLDWQDSCKLAMGQ